MAFLLTENLIDGDEVVFDAETPDNLGPERLQDPRLSAACRLTGDVKRIRVDFGGDITAKAIAFASTWFPRAYPILPEDEIAIALDLHGGTPGTGAVYGYTGPSGVIEYLGVNVFFFNAPLTFGWLDFTVASEEPRDVSRLWVEADPFVPALNVDYTFRDGADDSSQAETAETANVKYWDVGEQNRVWPLLWQKLTDAEATRMRRVRAAKGKAGQIVFGLYSDPALIPEFTLFGTFSSLPALSYRPRSGIQTCAAQVEESN